MPLNPTQNATFPERDDEMPSISFTQKGLDSLIPTQNTQTFYDKAFPALCLKLYQSGKRSYSVRFQHQGLRQLHTIGDADEISLSEAKVTAQNMIVHQRYGIGVDEALSSSTLSAYAEVFFPDYASRWKASTLKTNQRGFYRHIAPILGDTPVSQLSRQQVKQWFVGMVAQKGQANRLLPILSVMMKQAEQYGCRPANSNPCQNIPRPD